tara:strand:- start:2079 stop:3923 length:1845 start_codon:yes stop_codon:yes gene_type:complete
MEISGLKYRSIAERDSLSYSMDFSIDNNTGDATFGFSGENKLISFNFISGRMYDPEGRYFSSYTSGDPHAISGSIFEDNYNYYLDQKPINFKGTKENFQIENFFWNANNCKMTASTKITSDYFQHDINFDEGFYEQPDGSWELTGHVQSTDESSKFKIFSGEMISPSDFNIEILDTSPLIRSEVKINPQGNYSVWDSFAMDFNLYTNFGVLNKKIAGTLYPKNRYETNHVWGDMRGYTYTGNVANGVITGDYSLEVSSKFDQKIIVDKPMDVSLTYHSGYTGKFYRVTGVNVTYSGAGIDSDQDLSVVFSSSSDFNQLAKATPLTSGRVFQRKLENSSLSFPYINKTISAVTGVSITASGLYSSVPSVSFSGQYYENNGHWEGANSPYEDFLLSTGTASGEVLYEEVYEKTFTGSWNLSTGIESTNYISYNNAWTPLAVNESYGTEAYVNSDSSAYVDDADRILSKDILGVRVRYKTYQDYEPIHAKLVVSGAGHVLEERMVSGQMFAPPRGRPTPITELSAVHYFSQGDGSVQTVATFNWPKKDYNEDGFYLYHEKNTGWEKVASAEAGEEKIVYSAALSFGEHSFYLTSWNSEAESAPSNEIILFISQGLTG